MTDFILNAIDANAFSTDDTSAGYVNPTYWNRELLNHVESNMVVASLAKVYDDILGQDGKSFNVTVDNEPTAASAVDESAATSIKAQSHSQVTFTPSEYSDAYQITDKQARRGFFSEMQNMSQKIGYSLARVRESTAISTCQTGAGNAVVANGVASSDVASSDTMDFDDIVDARAQVRKSKLLPRYLIVSVGQAAQLMKDPQFYRADQSGDQSVFRQAIIGSIAGMQVIESDELVPTDSKSKALVLGLDAQGRAAFGIGRKALPEIRTEYHALDRKTDIVGTEEWDMQVLRADGICTLETYDDLA